MTNDLEQLDRLWIAAHTGRLPPDVGRWATRLIAGALPANVRRAERDRLLRQAASQTTGSLWHRANEVSAIIERFRRLPAELVEGIVYKEAPDKLVHRAWCLDHNLPRFRQLLTILRDSAIETP